ncbi:hypothetical protein FOA52_004364 [Chlamydomonas sp. UWO 241]|nr:hypothetical protein FOA52_004364 [Chlamydomonas sp. UWO 241]
MDALALDDLRGKLARLGVDFNLPSAGSPHRQPLSSIASPGRHSPPPGHMRLDQVSTLLQALDTVEAAVVHESEGGVRTSVAGKAGGAKKKVPIRRKLPLSKEGSSGGATVGTLAHSGVDIRRQARQLSAAPRHEPLSLLLGQYKDAETGWAHEKIRLRREADSERSRASKTAQELSRAERSLEHKGVEIRGLRAAMQERGAQLEGAAERIQELEDQLAKTRAKAAATISSVTMERDELKGLLMSSLQRLETANDIVKRAEAGSVTMQSRMAHLEAERLAALESAAAAVAEVKTLTEDRRKLQWQSKLLERMSEVQLKHNQHKSQAIRQLLSAQGDADAAEAAAALGLDLHDDTSDYGL